MTRQPFPMSVADLRAAIDQGDVDTVIVAFPDMQGRPVGKRVTAGFFMDHVLTHGIEACDYLLAVDVDMEPLAGYRFTNWDTGYGDFLAMPDLDTMRIIPWLEGSAMVICDLSGPEGNPVSVSPRAMLRRQIERAAEMGLAVKCATELEFFLFADSYEEAGSKNWRGLVPHMSTIEDYQLFQTAREEYLIREIRNSMVQTGIPIEFSKGEAGRGQHEINITYSDALQVADNHLVFKNGVKEIAAKHGRAATFMAKWSMNEVGSSCHVHASLWDRSTGEPVMGDPTGIGGLSQLGQQFLAGQLAAAREMSWCFAPYVNSYRRYMPGSWAPTATVWGDDNRTCGFRLVGHGPSRRVECRIPGADVNPYIVLAATIASGLWGIENKLNLPEPYLGNAYIDASVERVPSNLVDAIAEFEPGRIAKHAFGEEVHYHLLNTARQEWAKANSVVTDWELARNFERI
ncbi:MAG TPA: glutamine synthetase family protein [Acidimicrobiales bacterium]|nr:glutamine synthetase family protein [Acidimicrobiales bacterium]